MERMPHIQAREAPKPLGAARTREEHDVEQQLERAVPRPQPRSQPDMPDFGAIPIKGGGCAPALQSELVAGTTADEREADRVADLVTRTGQPAVSADPTAPVGEVRGGQVCAECARQGKRTCSCAQRKPDPAATAQRAPAHAPTPSSGNYLAESLDGRGQALPAEARTFFEPRFGHDFSHVRVHSDSSAAALARSQQAHALTAGRHIVFGTGRYAPGGPEGRKLLAHELTHVVQQIGSNGRAPQVQFKRPGPGSCGWLDEAASTVIGDAAHVQIQNRLRGRGLAPELPIPRASKRKLGSLKCQPATTDPGYADLAKLGGTSIGISEIKPFWRAGVQARIEAMHYILRSRQAKSRILRTGACARQVPDAIDFGFRAVTGLTTATTFAMLKGAIVGTEDFGPFAMDPRKNLLAKEAGAGAIGYWCRLNEEGKKKNKKDKEKEKKEKEKKKKEKEKEKEKKQKEKEKEKKQKEKEKEKKQKEKEKGKGEGSAGAANVGFGISIFSSNVGGANAGVGISVGSSSASVLSAGAGVSWFSDTASAGSAGVGVTKDTEAAGALTAGAGMSEDTMAAAAAAAGAGETSGVVSVGAGVAGAGKVEDSATAAAGVAGTGEVSGSMAASAGATGSGKVSGAVGASTGSPKQKKTDEQEAAGSGADKVPPGHSDEEVEAGESGTTPGEKRTGAGTGAGTEGTGTAAGQPGRAGVGGEGTGAGKPGTVGTGGGALGKGPGDSSALTGTGPAATGTGTAATGTGIAATGTTATGTTATGTGTAGTAGAGDLAVLPVFPSNASEADRAKMAAEAAKVAALLKNAEEAQKLLLQYLASQDATGQYLVPASDWVAKLLRVTKGLSPDEIEYLKQLNWKPGHLSEQELRERIRKALANRKPAGTGPTAGGGGKTPQRKGEGSGPGTGGTEGGKKSSRGDGPGTPGRDTAKSPGGGRDRATAPPPGTKHAASGDFGYVILSGISASSKLSPGQAVLCTVRIVELDGQRRTFVLDNVSITMDSRKDGNTVNLYFTKDFWSQKFKFHGLGGKETLSEYSFGHRRSHK
jgi:hypothetical protein